MSYRTRGKSYDGLGLAISPSIAPSIVVKTTPGALVPAGAAGAQGAFDAIVPPSCPATYAQYQAPPATLNPGDTLFLIWPMVKWSDAAAGANAWQTFVDLVGYPIEIHDRLYQTGFARGNKNPAWLPLLSRMGPACDPTAVGFRDGHPDAVCFAFPRSWRGQPAVVRAGMDGIAAPTAVGASGLFYQDGPWLSPDNSNPLIVKEGGYWDGAGALGPYGPIFAGFIPRPGNDQSVSRGVMWIATGIVGSQSVPSAAVSALLYKIGRYASQGAGIRLDAGLPVLGAVPYMTVKDPAFSLVVAARGLRTDDLLFSLERTDDAETIFGVGGRQDDPHYVYTADDTRNLYNRLNAFVLFEGFVDVGTMLDATGRRHGAHTRRGKIADAIVQRAADACAMTVESSVGGFSAALNAVITVPGGVNQAVRNTTDDIGIKIATARANLQRFNGLADQARAAVAAIPQIRDQTVAGMNAATDAATVDAIATAGKKAITDLVGPIGTIGAAIAAWVDPSMDQQIQASVARVQTQLTPEKLVDLAMSASSQSTARAQQFQAAATAMRCEALKQIRASAGQEWAILQQTIAQTPQTIADIQAARAQLPAASAAIQAVATAATEAADAINTTQSKRDKELGLPWWMAHWHGIPMYVWMGGGGLVVVGGLVAARAVVKRGRAKSAPHAAPAVTANRRRRSTKRHRRLHA